MAKFPTRKFTHKARSAKIAFYDRFFALFNQIMEQQATFSIIFSIPWCVSIEITWKFKNYFSNNFFLKKAKGVPLAFFKFLLKKQFLKFQIISIEIHQGILKMIENVACCFIIWSKGTKTRSYKAIFDEWAEQAYPLSDQKLNMRQNTAEWCDFCLNK